MERLGPSPPYWTAPWWYMALRIEMAETKQKKRKQEDKKAVECKATEVTGTRGMQT